MRTILKTMINLKCYLWTLIDDGRSATCSLLSIHHLLRRPARTSSERVTPEVNLWVRWALGGGGVNYLLPPRTGWPTTTSASYSDNSVQFSRDSAVVLTVCEQSLCRWHTEHKQGKVTLQCSILTFRSHLTIVIYWLLKL